MTEGRPRHRIARSRLPWRLRLLTDPAVVRHWLVVLVLAALLAGLVGRAISSADAARARWGPTATVVVAERELAAGDPLDASALRTVRWPAGLVPDGALRSLPPAGARADAPVASGTPLTSIAVRHPGEDDDERRTVAIPVGSAPLPAQVGERVDVWAIAEPGATPDGTDRAERVARDAEVVSTADGAVVLAVEPAEVEATATAAATAQVALVGGA